MIRQRALPTIFIGQQEDLRPLTLEGCQHFALQQARQFRSLVSRQMDEEPS